MDKNGKNRQKSSKMFQNGPKWFQMVQNGPKWSKMVKNSQNCQNGPNGQK